MQFYFTAVLEFERNMLTHIIFQSLSKIKVYIERYKELVFSSSLKVTFYCLFTCIFLSLLWYLIKIVT